MARLRSSRMATLARRVLKMLLFVDLFLLSARYVYGPISFASGWNEHYIFVVTDFLGIRGIELFELFEMLVGIIATLIFTALAYIALDRLYRLYRTAR